MFKREPKIPKNRAPDDLLDRIGKPSPVEGMTAEKIDREIDKIDNLHIQQAELDKATKKGYFAR